MKPLSKLRLNAVEQREFDQHGVKWVIFYKRPLYLRLKCTCGLELRCDNTLLAYRSHVHERLAKARKAVNSARRYTPEDVFVFSRLLAVLEPRSCARREYYWKHRRNNKRLLRAWSAARALYVNWKRLIGWAGDVLPPVGCILSYQQAWPVV